MKIPKSKIIEYLESLPDDMIDSNQLYTLEDDVNKKYRICPNRINQIDLSNPNYTFQLFIIPLYSSYINREELSDKTYNLLNELSIFASTRRLDYNLKITVESINMDIEAFADSFIIGSQIINNDIISCEWVPIQDLKDFCGSNLILILSKFIEILNESSLKSLNALRDMSTYPKELKEILLFL